MEGIAKVGFSWKSFFVNFGMHFCRFFEASFSDFLGLESTLKNGTIFSVKTNLESGIWLR